MSQSYVITALGSLIALLLAIIGFLVASWIRGVDRSLQDLAMQYTQKAVSEARIQGQIDSLQKAITATSKDVGLLSASIQKIWDIMISQGVCDRRPSDKALGNSR